MECLCWESANGDALSNGTFSARASAGASAIDLAATDQASAYVAEMAGGRTVNRRILLAICAGLSAAAKVIDLAAASQASIYVAESPGQKTVDLRILRTVSAWTSAAAKVTGLAVRSRPSVDAMESETVSVYAVAKSPSVGRSCLLCWDEAVWELKACLDYGASSDDP